MPRVPSSKAKRKKPRPREPVDESISHLHLVIDPELREKLRDHARQLDGPRDRPNLSAAVRDLLRQALGLPRTAAELADQDAAAPAA